MFADGIGRHTPELTGQKVIRALVIDSALLPHIGDAITQLTYMWGWKQVGDSIIDITDECKDALDSWYSPMIIGQVSQFLGDLPPGWLELDGSTYNNSDYPELAGMLDSQFISGSQFTLPDIRDLFLLSAGTINTLGDSGGSEQVTLTVDELPEHSHGYIPPTLNIDLEAPGAPDILAAGIGTETQTTTEGQGEPFSIMPPFFVVKVGIFSGRYV